MALRGQRSREAKHLLLNCEDESTVLRRGCPHSCGGVLTSMWARLQMRQLKMAGEVATRTQNASAVTAVTI